MKILFAFVLFDYDVCFKTIVDMLNLAMWFEY